MGLNAVLRRFAFARMQAFAVLGRGGALLWRTLLDTAPIGLARAPHDADLLVLAGDIPPGWHQSLVALFETFGLPRLVLWLCPPWSCAPPASLPLGYVAHDPATIDWPEIETRLLAADNPANAQLLPDEPPAPWRGRGDHGQGGEGMMGGKPYGRSMAMTMEDCDNLALDEVPTALGPYFPGLPTGLQLTLKMQGDRVRVCERVENRFPGWHLTPSAVREEPARRLLAGETVSIAELEQARLAAHLGWLAEVLAFAGLDSLGAELRRCRNNRDAAVIEPLLARAESRLLQKLMRGVGKITRAQANAWGLVGPVARASGLKRDARLSDPAYHALGFVPCIAAGGDVWARLQVRLRECRQALRLLEKAGRQTSRAAEGARGRFERDTGGRVLTPSAANVGALQPLLAGLEWFEAVLCVASLDLDMAEAALS